MTPISGTKGELRSGQKGGVACSVGISVLVRKAPGKATVTQTAGSATGLNLLSYVTLACMLTASEQPLYIYNFSSRCFSDDSGLNGVKMNYTPMTSPGSE